jgi:AcrR family transcriptional regulator
MSNGSRGSAPPTPHGTRQEILRAALRLFSERGYDAATIDDVAEAAGYTKGAVYWHFSSKDDLLVEVFEAWTREGMANLAAALRRPLAERVAALDEWHSGDPTRSRQWVRFELDLLRLAADKPELAARLRERQLSVRELLAREIEGVPGARLGPGETATLLDALSDGLLQQGLLDPAAVQGLFGKVVALLLPGPVER